MSKRVLLSLLLLVLVISLSFGSCLAEDKLSQYGEIYSILNQEVKLKCKNPMSGEIYLFKFSAGWDTSFEGVSGLAELKRGDFISVWYVLDLSNNATATKVSLPKELSTRAVSPSGVQSFDANEPLVKSLQDEIAALRSEVAGLKEELKQARAQ